MIAAIEWVPAGVADPNPKKYELNAAEQEVLEMLQAQEEGGDEQPTGKNFKSKKIKPFNKEEKAMLTALPDDLRMDEYSDDDDGDAAVGNLLMGRDDPELEGASDDNDDESVMQDQDEKNEITKVEVENDNDSDDDDNLDDVPDTREFMPTDVEGLEAMNFGDFDGGQAGLDTAEDDASEEEAMRISPDDAMVVVAKTEDDFASLEVHVYDTKNGSLFIHHDIPLPSFPLCLAHGQISNSGDSNNNTGTGNFCAVGTFDPGIEIWNLDIINALEPTCVLGGQDTSQADEIMKENMLRASSGQKLKKVSYRGEATQLKPGSHTDAVMGLSWNQVHRHVIASGSADHTVKIWDVSQATTDANKAVAGTFAHHSDKVQSVQWHPVEATILATGSFDRTVALLDARDNGGQNIKKVKIPADCEALAWDPFHPEYLTAACEDGTVITWDVRNFSSKAPLWSFSANEYGGISDLSYNRHVPGMLVTSSIDKTVALWDTYSENDAPQKNCIPRQCGIKEMKVGKLYTVSFYPSSPWLLGCGGSDNQLALWDMSSEDAIFSRFGKRMEEGWKEAVESKQDAGKETDFEAVMATNADSHEGQGAPGNKKKKKGKNKKKAHRRGR